MLAVQTPVRLLPLKEVINRVSYSRASIYAMTKEGRFPRPVKLGPNRVGWVESAVAAWINAKINEAA